MKNVCDRCGEYHPHAEEWSVEGEPSMRLCPPCLDLYEVCEHCESVLAEDVEDFELVTIYPHFAPVELRMCGDCERKVSTKGD